MDANLVVRMHDPESAEYPAVMSKWERWTNEEIEVVVPSLLRYEVTNAVYRSARNGLLSDSSAIGIIQSLDILPFRYVDSLELNVAAFEIAKELNLPAAYDAHYLALARREDAVLFTADRRLVRAALPAFPLIQDVMDE